MFNSLAIRNSIAVHSLGIVLALSLQIGCKPVGTPMSDASQAKTLMQITMEQWRSGDSLAGLRKQSPPVYVTEDLWRNGAMLNE
ncbi:MAG TPA: hypothetical protein VM260_04550, partial [Pirellula sp.]|nr:hypothetical protein [Pirellula sp.]